MIQLYLLECLHRGSITNGSGELPTHLIAEKRRARNGVSAVKHRTTAFGSLHVVPGVWLETWLCLKGSPANPHGYCQLVSRVESLGFLECHAGCCDIVISSTPACEQQTHSRTGTLHEQVTKSRFLRAFVVVGKDRHHGSYHGVRSIWRPLDLSNIASASKQRLLTLNIGNIPIAPWSPNRWFCC